MGSVCRGGSRGKAFGFGKTQGCWAASWLQEFRFSAFLIGSQRAAAPAVVFVVCFSFVPVWPGPPRSRGGCFGGSWRGHSW